MILPAFVDTRGLSGPQHHGGPRIKDSPEPVQQTARCCCVRGASPQAVV
ncbi:hypothetical protein Salmuc_05365 [Salipiger mucosus DSM 16094]|uniref:Uncharacterized protein n=1 Tax=Salipiger mucosus DSM 16094 TaxID=1123237 RepID=S9Q8N3_9RHOB|nr:hypothetical protein Salmuc_05365 [Salipiger mucosus DSM 16094]